MHDGCQPRFSIGSMTRARMSTSVCLLADTSSTTKPLKSPTSVMRDADGQIFPTQFTGNCFCSCS